MRWGSLHDLGYVYIKDQTSFIDNFMFFRENIGAVLART